MKRPALRTRWAAYAIAGAATIAAVAWASRLPAPDAATTGVVHADAARRVTQPRVDAAPATSPGLPWRPRSATAVVTADPFSPIGGSTEAAPPTPAKAASAVAAVAVAAPTLPLVYVGRWDEHGERTAILDEGGQVVFAKAGDTLDGQYHVASVTEDQVVIERLPGHEQQTLSLSGMGAFTPSSSGDTQRVEGGPASAGSPDSTD